MAGDRPIRCCDLCGGVDDHPRHVVVGDPGFMGADVDQEIQSRIGDNVTDLLTKGKIDGSQAIEIMRDYADRASQNRHYDCCRAVGCPSGTCGPATEGAENLRGAKLLTHLMKIAPPPPEPDPEEATA